MRYRKNCLCIQKPLVKHTNGWREEVRIPVMLDHYWMHVSLKSRKSLVFLTSNHQLIVCSTGGPVKISVDDHLSEYLITNCTLNEEQRAKQWDTIAKECGLQLSSHTVARILKEHGCQSRRIPPLKPPLHKNHKQYRKDFTF